MGFIATAGAQTRVTTDTASTDVTFFVCADLHFGLDGIDIKHDSQIAAMNALPGKPAPPNFQSGTVDRLSLYGCRAT